MLFCGKSCWHEFSFVLHFPHVRVQYITVIIRIRIRIIIGLDSRPLCLPVKQPLEAISLKILLPWVPRGSSRPKYFYCTLAPQLPHWKSASPAIPMLLLFSCKQENQTMQMVTICFCFENAKANKFWREPGNTE